MSVILKNVDRIVNSSGDAIDFAQGVGGGSSKEFVATGNISQGQTVGLKADGTVEAVGTFSTPQTGVMGTPFLLPFSDMHNTKAVYDSNTKQYIVATILAGSWKSHLFTAKIDGNTLTYGASTEFRDSSFSSGEIVLIPNTNKFVIFFNQDGGTLTGRGTARVGEISGTDIVNLGTPVIYNSNNSKKNAAAYHEGSGKVILVNENSVYLGTISGNSLSFGTPANLGTSIIGEDVITIPNSNKIIITGKDSSATDQSKIFVGEVVSGSSITLSSPMTYAAGDAWDLWLKYDQTTGQILATSRTTGSVNRVYLGTLSGNSIAFGAPSNLSHDFNSLDKDENTNQYIFGSTGNNAPIIRGEISGNSMTFSSPEIYTTGYGHFVNAVMDSNTNQLTIFYSDWSSAGGQAGYAAIATLNGNALSTNASSWLGIADNAITSGGSGKVNLNGSIDSHQTGLTAGNTYYVNYDGTLTDTPNEGEKNGTYGKIGKALSSTSLLLSK